MPAARPVHDERVLILRQLEAKLLVEGFRATCVADEDFHHELFSGQYVTGRRLIVQSRPLAHDGRRRYASRTAFSCATRLGPVSRAELPTIGWSVAASEIRIRRDGRTRGAFGRACRRPSVRSVYRRERRRSDCCTTPAMVPSRPTAAPSSSIASRKARWSNGMIPAARPRGGARPRQANPSTSQTTAGSCLRDRSCWTPSCWSFRRQCLNPARPET